MYPTLYHAFLDLFGVDIPALKFLNSFGFFVAVAFVFAHWTLASVINIPIVAMGRAVARPLMPLP